MGKLGICIALALAVVGGARGDEGDARANAKAHFEKGTKLYNLTDYAGARVEFQAGYLAVPSSAFLFNLAQCARMLGETAESVKLYRNFLRVEPNTPNRADVEGFIRDGDAEIQRRAAERPPTGLASPPEAGATAPTAPAEPPPPTTEAPRSRTWLWVTIGAAAAVVVAAIAIGLGVGLTRGPTAPDTTYGNVAVLP